MKILFFIPNIENKGGVERATVSIINALSESELVNVSLLVLNYKKNRVSFKISPKVNVLSLDLINYKTQYFKVIHRIRKVICDIDYVVSVESMSLLFTLLPVSLLKNKPKLIVWEHFNFKNNNGRKLRSYLRKVAAKRADLIVTLTARDVEEWKKNIVLKSKITYIFNISPFEDLQPKYDNTSKTAIAIGRYVPVKGFDRLIKAWSIFEKKHPLNGWNLKIIGFGDDKNHLHNLITQEKINSIYLEDGSKDVVQHYKNAGLYCMSSYFEGLPMVLIEAQNFGLPSISFDIFAGPSEILGVGSGILIENNNLDAYAEGLHQLTSQTEIRNKMSKCATENKHRFNGNEIANEWISKLKNI